MAQKITSKFVLIVLMVLGSLISVLYNPQISQLFTYFIFGSFLYIQFDPINTIKIENKVNRVKSTMYGTLGWISAILITFIVLGIFSSQSLFGVPEEYSFEKGSINSVFELVKQTQSSLAFEGSKFFEFISFGFFIAIAETIWFVMILYEIGIELGKLLGQNVAFNTSKISLFTIILFSLISYAFMFYHLSSKGINNNPALISVFIFGFISLLVTMLEGQVLGAIIMHIINNSVALILTFGVTFTPILIGIGIAFGIYLLISRAQGTFSLKLFGG